MAKSKNVRERTEQLSKAKEALGNLQAELMTLRKRARSRGTLWNHLVGFYDEIDKLAKGRTLVEATPLVVDRANEVIRDAKQIVENDVYLDRIKEFVPAGNNPVYPDVLVTMRSVRQSLQRCEKTLEKQEEQKLKTLTRARTVVGALECYLSDDENSELALKEDVDRYVVGDVDDFCFDEYEFDNTTELCFDFDSFDSQPLEEYLKVDEDNETDELGDEEE